MGLALGFLGGVALGNWLNKRISLESDRVLPLVLGMVFLPLAVLPAQPEFAGIYRIGLYGWPTILAGAAASLPLGGSTGCAWSLLRLEPVLSIQSSRKWGGWGVGLGIMVGAGSALALSTFKGAFLVNLFAAPLVWPTLPMQGDRTLLVRMLLTLVVMLSCMFLLFL
jgi:hypothetical protein